MTSLPECCAFSWRDERYRSFNADCCVATPCVISTIA
ncbi:Uncharacterised protein [Vibrio cholerae]|nr:Uncharacterised protein [Vibrio cholerae]